MSLQESITARLGLDTSEFKRGLRRATADLKSVKEHLDTLGLSVGLGVAWHGLNKLVEKVQELKDLSDDFGMGTDFLQGVQSRLQITGASAEVANKAIRTFVLELNKAQEGDDGALKKFKDLNVAIKDQNGLRRGGEEVLRDVMDALQRETDETVRAGRVADIFGARQMAVNEAFREGAKAIDDLVAAKKNAGTLLTQEDIENIDTFGERIKEMQSNLEYFGAKFLSPIIEWMGRLSRFLGTLSQMKNTGNSVLGDLTAAMEITVQQDMQIEQSKREQIALMGKKRGLAKESNAEEKKAQADEKKLEDELKKLQDDREQKEKTLNQLFKERRSLIDDIKLAESVGDKALERRVRLEENRLAIEKQRTELGKDFQSTVGQIGLLEQDIKKSKGDRLKFGSLEELVSRDPRGLDKEARRQRMAAIQIQRMQNDVDFFKGKNPEKAARIQAEIDSRLKGLSRVSDSVTSPFKHMEDRLAIQVDYLEMLVSMIRDGISVTPKNGK